MRISMIYRCWCVALLLSTFFWLPVLLIRAQPYDDGGLRDFLTPPEGCPAPCFMGIRPGVTSVEEMARILSEHPWVRWNGGSRRAFPASVQLGWQWSKQAPAWLDVDNPTVIVLNSEKARIVVVLTRITRAELLLALGRPDSYHVGVVQELTYEYEAWYGDLGMLVQTAGVCSSTDLTYDLPVMLSFQAELSDSAVGFQSPTHRCQ